MTRGVMGIVAIVLGMAVALPIGIYGAGSTRLIDVRRSPDGSERIEFYSPARWRTWFVGRRDLAAYARLVRVDDTTVTHDSDVFDLSGEGQIVWGRKEVQIGTSAVYDRRAARWTIIQE